MKMYVETAFESLFKHGEELCGDKVEIVRDENSTVVVLADGLGSGVKANILATLTSKIVATMVINGATISETVETVASTLPVCAERGVAYSTFTILRVFNDGRTIMVEFDNPEAVLLRRGKPVELEKTTLEIGGKTILESRFQTKPEDMLVIFSDGAIHAGVGTLLDLGWQRENIVEYLQSSYSAGVSSHTMTSRLISACDNLYMQSPGDDTTVVAVRICQPLPATIMVGPPLDNSKDEYVVRELMSSEGLKVVCGGTTSQIVSKIIGREMDISIEYFNPAIPPTATIDGIDLVTEGVLTLRKTLEYIDKYMQNQSLNLRLIQKKDGASRLARLLIEQCTQAHFLVGRALNPAHQNPDLPINLGIKLQLVNDIAQRLKDSGKTVTVEYY